MSAWLQTWPWYAWLGIAWVAVMILFVWLHHRFQKRIGDSMRQWEDDEHKDSAT